MAPDTRYARSGEFSIAYQVVGEGDLDLVAGSGIEFEDRGVHELKGVPGAVAPVRGQRLAD